MIDAVDVSDAKSMGPSPKVGRSARVEAIMAGQWREALEQTPDWSERVLYNLSKGGRREKV